MTHSLENVANCLLVITLTQLGFDQNTRKDAEFSFESLEFYPGRSGKDGELIITVAQKRSYYKDEETILDEDNPPSVWRHIFSK